MLEISEIIVIVESVADARTSTKLAERVLIEKTADWIDEYFLQNLFQWSGLEINTKYSCWGSIDNIIKNYSNEFNFPAIRSNGGLKTDGKSVRKIITLINFLRYKQNRNIKAVLFIRDLDNQPKRREDMEKARSGSLAQQPKLEIVIGTADRMREAWVLNGFVPSTPEEERILEEIKTKLRFDPCEEAHRLRSNSWEEPDRIRNPKVVVETLTESNYLREQQCWEEANLELLRARGNQTGLTAYLDEIEQRLIPVILE